VAGLLAIYLNDHLAGATGGIELARRLVSSNRGTEPYDATLRRICEEIEADRATLEQLVTRLGYEKSRVKPALAWLAEKGGRLKLNGRLRGYSPLSRVLELEGLQMGITAKLQLWHALQRLGPSQTADLDLEALVRRAEEQRSTVEELHRHAVGALTSA
jgi:hypothetical protein